jgi:hypothetical protein
MGSECGRRSILYIDSRQSERGCCLSSPDVEDWRVQATSTDHRALPNPEIRRIRRRRRQFHPEAWPKRRPTTSSASASTTLNSVPIEQCAPLAMNVSAKRCQQSHALLTTIGDPLDASAYRKRNVVAVCHAKRHRGADALSRLTILITRKRSMVTSTTAEVDTTDSTSRTKRRRPRSGTRQRQSAQLRGAAQPVPLLRETH